ncbi:hypothetical protein NC653_005186 [Populus alba x Populus x berolinensis]|uniref:Uncharacterized protein n=1 Tax=Populus alba x Populus x berolinensis TaxID=444605 RepID=A0AAD6WAR8_9ROSI|nr:hypothetical protein NC653_005186 [Populus alba x Populus x berolinensis]
MSIFIEITKLTPGAVERGRRSNTGLYSIRLLTGQANFLLASCLE